MTANVTRSNATIASLCLNVRRTITAQYQGVSEVCNLRKLLVAPVAGSGDIEAFMLPAGLTAVAVHAGAYEQLPETFAALEEWIRTQGRAPAGAPWEVYVTDPTEHPDPADWRTEIWWPVS